MAVAGDPSSLWSCYPGYDPRAGQPVPGGLSARLWADCQQQALEGLHHPFLAALAAGTLDRSCFQAYIAQDAAFLDGYAKTYAAALDKCRRHTPPDTDGTSGAANGSDSGSENTRSVLLQLLLGIHLELRLHGAYAARWGVVLGGGRPAAATTAYTDFLAAIAADPEASVAEVLAAMVPCSRLYGYLGCTLAAATGGRRHAYSEWLDTYSSIEYLVSPIMKEKLFDELGKDVPYERLKDLYSRAMQLEVNFFSAQPNVPPPRDIRLLVVDFDDTCSEKDTIGVLLNTAVEANARAAGAAAADATRQQLSARISQLSDSYLQKQAALVAQLLQPAEQQQQQCGADAASAGCYDAAGLLQFCEALSDFDRDMNQVVIDAGCLKGLTAADLSAAGTGIKLRPGCAATLSAAAAAGIPVAVLSVNWSKTLMQAALAAAAAAEPAAAASQQQQQLEIYANEMEWDGSSSISTGGLQRQVENGRDKARVMQQLMQQHDGSGSSGSGSAPGGGAVVYVGDSASDILPLLQADYGVVIGTNKLLRRALAAFGVRLQPLCSAPLTPPPRNSTQQQQGQAPPVLYEAGSWQEIAAFLFGPSSYDQDGPGTYPGMVHVPTGRGAAAVAAAAAAAAAAPAAAAAAAAGVRGRSAGPPLVLTIAGSDSGGGAGIQADIKTIMANGGFGMSAVTALTAQNSAGVQGVHAPPPAFLLQQLDSVLGDLPPAAMKTGMLPDAATVSAVAARLRQYISSTSSSGSQPGPCFLHTVEDEAAAAAADDDGSSGQQSRRRWLRLVVDPVMISTSGHSLAAGGVGRALATELVPLAAVITPNLAEAEALCGDGRTITSIQDMKAAAAHLHKLGCAAVLVKGGHLAEKQQQRLQSAAAAAAAAAAGSGEVQAVDVLYDGHKYYFFTAPYISTPNTHGTGCTLAAAIATGLGHGLPLVEAVQAAKDYLTSVLAASAGLALGAGPQHPFHHGAGFGRGLLPFAGPAGAAAGSMTAAAAGFSSSGSSSGNGGGKRPLDLRLYVVTDPGCNKATGRSLFEAVRAAVAGGATVVQIREKEADGGDFLEETRAVIRLCRPLGVPVIINDRVDVALAAGADGVHVGQADLPAAAVRRLIGPDKILGVSVKTPAEAAKAQADGADYIGVGAVFPTGTKASSVVGLEGLEACVAVSGLPAVAIGGVGAANAAAVMGAGVAGLAVVSAVFAAPDVEAAARELRQAVDAALEEQQQQHEAVAAAV